MNTQHLYTNIGRRIADERAKHHVTQETLAACLKMSRTALANIEAGRQRTGLHVILAIAVILECPLDMLLGDRLGDEEEDAIIAYRDEIIKDGGKKTLKGKVADLEARLAENERLLQSALRSINMGIIDRVTDGRESNADQR